MNIKKENPLCSICLTDITLNKKELGCKHNFHKQCIDKWLEKKSNCPICRKEVIEDEPVVNFRSDSTRRRVSDDLFGYSTFEERTQYYRNRLNRARERFRRLEQTRYRNTYWT